MSQLYLAADADILADRLLEQIAANQKDADLFEPVHIVVPNRFLEQWLKFRIARSRGVAINVRFSFLEHALWDWLRELDPRTHPQPPELLGEERYQLMVLSILWSDTSPILAPLQDDFGPAIKDVTRAGCRHAWRLAERFAGLFRDYEYHRQDSIVQPWLKGAGIVDVPPAWREREAIEREIFRRIVDPENGRRTLLRRAALRNFKTFPQYVMELLCEIGDFVEYRKPPRRQLHLFGLSQISPLHVRAIELVGNFHDLHIFHFNPLASRSSRAPTLDELRAIAERFRQNELADANPGGALLRAWGRAGAESLDLTADFLRDRALKAVPLPTPPKSANHPLPRLQALMLGDAASSQRLPQDSTIQIVACPGVWREAETIHATIVHLLDKNPSLRQSDVAILVSDIEAYRPALTAVFDRPPRRLSFGLADYSAARVSVYGQALIGMLDAALENLSRSRVFEILLNPCVLARFKVGRESALHWPSWAEELGIFHSWDAAEKQSLGYRESPLYSWRLGLQKLRLGKYMSTAPDDSDRPAPQWQGVIPFADVESGDRERLDQFCRLVEGLLPTLVRLRRLRASAQDWAETLTAVIQRFLAIPDDRPEEEPVRDALLESLTRFAESDAVHGAAPPLLPLALVREFLAGRLREIPGRRNEALAGGVTIAALKPQRPVPFSVVVLAGMGERHFPGGSAPSSFDLRQVRRQAGDIAPVDQQRLSFLEAILAARQKLIITYNARDLQKDETLQPAIPVTQLQRFLSKYVTTKPFQSITVPLTPHDIASLDASSQPAWQDVIVGERDADRVLALDAAETAGQLSLSATQAKALDELRVRFIREFPMPPSAPESRPTATVTLAMLSRFLSNPADAALRFHIRAASDWESEQEEDCEPLTSDKWTGINLVTQTLKSIVRRSATDPVARLAEDWPSEFDRKYHEGTLRGQMPEGEFAEVDAEILRGLVRTSLKSGLVDFLSSHPATAERGPYLIGESVTPIGANRHLPALTLTLPRSVENEPSGECRLVGSWEFAWRNEKTLDLLVFVQEPHKENSPLTEKLFEPLLFALALIASGEVGTRRLILHLAGPKEFISAPLEGDLLNADAARFYLSELAADFLDVRCADQLPFATLNKEFPALYTTTDGMSCAADLLEDFRNREDDCDWGYPQSIKKFTEIGFRVPDDAAEKLRRRFHPLFALFPAPAPKPVAKSATSPPKTSSRKRGAK